MAEEIHKKNEQFAKKVAKQRAKDTSLFKFRGAANYKPTLYPLNLDVEDGSSPKTSWCKSLVEICCGEIVSDPSSMERALAMGEVPSGLCWSLLKAALQNNQDVATQVLMSHWPSTSFSFSALSPPTFVKLKALYDGMYVCGGIQICRDLTCSIVVNFLECLTKQSPTKLKYVDISGYPTGDSTAKYAALHAEVFQCESYEVPENIYVIRLDAVVHGNKTCMQLCKALKLGNANKSLLRLRIKRLEVTFTKTDRLAALLEQLDPKDLVALSIRSSNPQCEEFQSLAPQFRNFTSLTGLDLSYNGINFMENGAIVLGETLAQLPVLTRLNLGRNRLTNQLQSVISKMSSSLSHLKLHNCELAENDFTFLTNSHHVSTLRALDLSKNDLKTHFQPFLQLLSALESHLIVLETACCSFQPEHLTHLLQKSLPNFCHLRLWNIASNITPTVDFLRHVTAIAGLPSFEILLVSFPTELGTVPDSFAMTKLVDTLKNMLPDSVLTRYFRGLAIRFR